MSIDFWWRNSSYPNEGRGNLILKDNENRNIFGMRYSPIIPYYFFNNTKIFAGNIIPNDNDWHHIALVYNSYDFYLYLYVDGSEKVKQPYIWFRRPITQLQIAGENWKYELDELSIWQGALTAEEVAEIYNY